MKLMSENISTIAKALVAAQKEMGNAVKDSKNPFFKSKYADLNAVREAVLPSFNKYGISVIQPTLTLEGKKFVQTMFIHESGEYISGLTEILAGSKETDAQAQGSGISYARRYGLQSMANVGAEDDDGNAASGKKTEAITHATTVTTTAATNSPAVNKVLAEHSATISQSTPGRRSFRKSTTSSEEL